MSATGGGCAGAGDVCHNVVSSWGGLTGDTMQLLDQSGSIGGKVILSNQDAEKCNTSKNVDHLVWLTYNQPVEPIRRGSVIAQQGHPSPACLGSVLDKGVFHLSIYTSLGKKKRHT